MGGFRLDAGRRATVAELLDDPLSGVSFSWRGGRPLDCGQLLDPAKGLFARVLGDNGNLPAGGMGRLPRCAPQVEMRKIGWSGAMRRNSPSPASGPTPPKN
jgi:hypothetical protein